MHPAVRVAPTYLAAHNARLAANSRAVTHETPSKADAEPKPAPSRSATRTDDFPVYDGSIGPACGRHPQALRRERHVHLRPRLHLDRKLRNARSPISTATRASCCIAAIRSSSWPSTPTSSRSATCCCTANCRRRQQMADFEHRITHHTMVHEQLRRFFRGFRRDAHPMAIMTGCVGALSAFYHDFTNIYDPKQREIASHRLIAKMPTIAAMAFKYIDRPALRLSAQRSRLFDQFPAHVLLGAGRGLQAQSGADARDGPDLHPARRSRAERLDLDGAAGRLVRRQSVRLHRRRHRLPLGPGAWRRQRSGAEDAEGDRHASTASPNTSSAPRTRTTPSA